MIEKDSNIYFEILKEKNRKTMLPDSLAFLSRFAYNVKSKKKKKRLQVQKLFGKQNIWFSKLSSLKNTLNPENVSFLFILSPPIM